MKTEIMLHRMAVSFIYYCSEFLVCWSLSVRKYGKSW